jgi:hypothetical protein
MLLNQQRNAFQSRMKVNLDRCQFGSFEILAALDINQLLKVRLALVLLFIRTWAILHSALETRFPMWVMYHPLLGMLPAELRAESRISVASSGGAAVFST